MSTEPSAFVPRESGIYCASFACIKDADSRVLMLKRTDMNRWCLPGGIVEIGESLTDAVRRECIEEIGVEVRVEGFQGFYTRPDRHLFLLKDGRKLHYFAFVFRCRVLDMNFRFEPTEAAEWGFFASDEIPNVVPSHRYWIEDCYVETGHPFLK